MKKIQCFFILVMSLMQLSVFSQGFLLKPITDYKGIFLLEIMMNWMVQKIKPVFIIKIFSEL